VSSANGTRAPAPVARAPSSIPGLDTILHGGFLRAGLYMIQGPPGAGKTVLASQIIYNAAANGAKALFVTVLGENHGRMMIHLRTMRFFDESLMPEHVAYVSAYNALETDGLPGITTLIRREVLARGSTMLVLDGVSAIEAVLTSELDLKRFTHGLQTLASATDCTMFLLTTSESVTAPERTMVDGLIELKQRLYGARNERRLLVQKMRGSGFIEGEHAFRIDETGVTVFPRTEAAVRGSVPELPFGHAPVTTGVATLDTMLGGGIPAASVTAIVGPYGTGKTTLGLQFLSRSTADQPGLLFGCFEPPTRLRTKAAGLGFDLAGAEQRGVVTQLWYPVGEHILDELATQLLDAVGRRGIRRLLIDGVYGFQQAALEPERIVRFWSALTNELRSLGVTTMHTLELPEFGQDHSLVPIGAVSSMAEVQVLLRSETVTAGRRRLISLVKVKDTNFDQVSRIYDIRDVGLVVLDGVADGPDDPAVARAQA